MKTLEECRKELDIIDKQVIELFEKRMNVIKDVALYKKENNLPILDEQREKMMLETNVKKFKNIGLRKYYKTVLQAFLKTSKQYQKEIIQK